MANYKFTSLEVDGQVLVSNPASFVMDKDKNMVANYSSEVMYVSVKVSNSTSAPKSIDVKTTATITIPANGSVDVSVKAGDEIILK